jgi:DNA gyrase subunit B
MPPLYKISFGKEEKYVYSDEDKETLLKEILEKNPDAKIGMQRYKGLGEMNPEQLWTTTMDPKTRMLKKINVTNEQKSDDAFSVLMGDEVAPRKKFIQSHAYMAQLDI